MSKLTNEDKSLFAEAVKDVTQLNPLPTVVMTSSYRQKPRLNQPHSMPTDFSAPKMEADDVSSVSAHQKLLFKRPQLDSKAFKRIQKGLFDTYWQLDLHGLTELAADQQLQRFIQEALDEKARYLIIIHGKGYNSDTHQPVLKNLVNQRLRQFSQILGFCSAQPKDGGTGAVYVFLQKQDPRSD